MAVRTRYCCFCWQEVERQCKWFDQGDRHALVCSSCQRLLWRNYTMLEEFYDHVTTHAGFTLFVFSSLDDDALSATRDWKVSGKVCACCLKLSHGWHNWYGPKDNDICLRKKCDWLLWRDYFKLEDHASYKHCKKLYHRYLLDELYRLQKRKYYQL